MPESEFPLARDCNQFDLYKYQAFILKPVQPLFYAANKDYDL